MVAERETNFIGTVSGNRFDLDTWQISKISLEDICIGLSHTSRFHGQTEDIYTVAEHSMRVADLVPPEYRLEALLHDGGEYILGDMASPLKKRFPLFKEMENAIMDQVVQHFGLNMTPEVKALIKEADNIMMATEKRDLRPRDSEEWSYLDKVKPMSEHVIPSMDPKKVRDIFMGEIQQCLEARGWKEPEVGKEKLSAVLIGPEFQVGEKFKFQPGDKVVGDGYRGAVIGMYSEGMVEVRLPGGAVCIPAYYPDCYPAVRNGVEIVTDGQHIGVVKEVGTQFVTMDAGRGRLVAIEANRFDKMPEVGGKVTVQLDYGKAKIIEPKARQEGVER